MAEESASLRVEMREGLLVYRESARGTTLEIRGERSQTSPRGRCRSIATFLGSPTDWLRAYPSRPMALYVIQAQVKCNIPR